MTNQLINQKQQSILVPNELTRTVTELSNNLSLIKPNNSKEIQIITYTLIATAIVGLFVYHYIKEQEQIN